MTKPGALQHRRHRMVQHVRQRTHGRQTAAYQKEAYDGHEREEMI